MAGGSYYSYVESNLKSPVGFCSFWIKSTEILKTTEAPSSSRKWKN
jgi:hypothetical protein